MGLCSPPKVFSVQLLKAASWAAFFCPARGQWGLSGLAQPAPWPAGAAFAFVNLDRQAADLGVPGALNIRRFTKVIRLGTLDLMHQQSLSVLMPHLAGQNLSPGRKCGGAPCHWTLKAKC
jgi:hypothetical protein